MDSSIKGLIVGRDFIIEEGAIVAAHLHPACTELGMASRPLDVVQVFMAGGAMLQVVGDQARRLYGAAKLAMESMYRPSNR